MSQPSVSLIIATYNRHGILGSTLAMVLAQDYEDLEVVVVDQTATPFPSASGFAEKAMRRFLYDWHPHPNLPAARNRGLSLTSGEIVIFLDDDVSIDPDYVREIVATYTSEDIGAVCGVSLPERCEDLHAESAKYAYLLEAKQPFDEGHVLSVGTMIGVNMSFRRSVFSRVGRFDEAFSGTGWGEDSELSFRVQGAGYRLLLNTRIKVIHLEPEKGGCSNRDPQAAERVRRERFVYPLYTCFKHARTYPVRTLLVSYRIWRAHVFNKKVLRSGLRTTVKRQAELLSAARGVIAYLAGSRTAL